MPPCSFDTLLGQLEQLSSGQRDALLQAVHAISSVDESVGIGKTTTGRNGGGDPYFTDGMIKIGVLVPDTATAASSPHGSTNVE